MPRGWTAFIPANFGWASWPLPPTDGSRRAKGPGHARFFGRRSLSESSSG
jgi:hypothetical protein